MEKIKSNQTVYFPTWTVVKIEEYNVLSGRTMTKPPMSRSNYVTIFLFQITDGLALASPHITKFSLIGVLLKKRKYNQYT